MRKMKHPEIVLITTQMGGWGKTETKKENRKVLARDVRAVKNLELSDIQLYFAEDYDARRTATTLGSAGGLTSKGGIFLTSNKIKKDSLKSYEEILGFLAEAKDPAWLVLPESASTFADFYTRAIGASWGYVPIKPGITACIRKSSKGIETRIF